MALVFERRRERATRRLTRGRSRVLRGRIVGQDRRSMLEVGCHPSGQADVASSRPTPTWQGIAREPWATPKPQPTCGQPKGTPMGSPSLWRVPENPEAMGAR